MAAESFSEIASVTDSPVHSAARCPPGVVVCAVGDIHGRLDLLEPALEALFRIRREAWTAGKSFAAVMLGDYIDRGPDSRGVLARLAALADSEEGRGFVFLRGNHEQELLDLVDGRTHSHRWLEFGGVETLNSYYHGSGERFVMDPDADLAGLIAAAAPAEHIRFLRRTQLFVVFGDYVFVHAGLDPDAPLEAQTTDDMLWRRALTDETPRHGLTVVHGHSIHHIPVMSRWRIGIDTGAYATGALSILRLEDAACSLIKVSRSGAERRILVAPWETVGSGFETSPAPEADSGDPTAGSTAGLAAPRPVQAMPGGRAHVRPLLTLKKREIVEALTAAGAGWREDASNETGDYLRNRIRHEVVPAWVAVAGGRDALAGAALSRELLEEDDAALEAWLEALAPLDADGRLDVKALAGKPRAVVRRALHRWLGRQAEAGDLSRQGFALLLAAVEAGRATRFSLGRGGFAVIRKGGLIFQKALRRRSPGRRK